MGLMGLKNNLFEQQFGFERQICNLINKFTGYAAFSYLFLYIESSGAAPGGSKRRR
jgi:hypothetical protein